jgi:hypothetical protein
VSDHERIGRVETVVVDGRAFTGVVYHVRTNGWACIETLGHVHYASGPAPRSTTRKNASPPRRNA